MLEYTTEEIVEGISKNDNVVIQYVYDRYFLEILRIVEYYGGNKNDAFDIFQDVMLTIFEQLTTGEGKEITNFRPYFISLCKFTWLKALRNGKYNENKAIDVSSLLPEVEYREIAMIWNENIEKEMRDKLFISSFIDLNSACQKIIRRVAYGWKTEKIADDLGITLAYAYKRRAMCIQKLIKLIKQKM